MSNKFREAFKVCSVHNVQQSIYVMIIILCDYFLTIFIISTMNYKHFHEQRNISIDKLQVFFSKTREYHLNF